MYKLYLSLIIFLMASIVCQGQNSALRFDGQSEKLTIPNKAEFNIDKEFTLEAWIYANEWNTLSWQGSLICTDSHPESGFAFRCGDNGTLSFVMATPGVWNEALSAPIMNAKQWHHVASVVNNGSITLYIDGQEAGSATYSDSPSASILPLNIGSSAGFQGRFFNGVIDEVRVWNVARTATQIADNKSEDLKGDESGLVTYLPMNEGTGTVVGNLADPNGNAAMIDMDESNWLEGYTLPEFDISLQGIGGIDLVNMKTRPVKMQIKAQNSGTNPISNVEAEVIVDGSLVFTETIGGSFAVGESKTIVLSTPIDLIDSEDPQIEVVLSHPDDANSLNNMASTQIFTKAGNSVILFEREQHNFGSAGQNQFNSVVLPSDLSNYSEILLHITVECPGGGCDPWDQAAKVIANTSSGSYEIARYITPYGIACGPWTVNVTDFKSIFQGNVDFNSFIQVWGQSGWLATLELELIEGQDDTPYSRLTPIYQDDYQVYGDPGISHDLETKDVDVAANTESSHIRMTISGHGQGNTNNAAEFYNVTHDMIVNGSLLEQHVLWKDDCNANSCDDQAGNWLFPRAGWCPGQEVSPRIFDTSSDAIPGQSVSIDYELQDYTNLLNTGYNNSGHTEPFYRIHSFFIEESSSRYKTYSNLLVKEITPTISGSGASATLDKVEMTIQNNGTETISTATYSYMINNVLIDSKAEGSSVAPGEEKVITFDILGGFTAGIDNVFYGIITSEEDQNVGDDAAKSLVKGSTSVDDLTIESMYKVFPNPTSQQIVIELDQLLKGGQLTINTVDGKILSSQVITDNRILYDFNNSGTFFVKIISQEGYTDTKKVVVIK